MADEYVYFLFNEHGYYLNTFLRRPEVRPGFKCLAVFADRLIVGADAQQ